MVPLWVQLLLLVAAGMVLLYHGTVILFAAQLPRLEPSTAPPSSGPRPRVSVVIAARDEELDLPETLNGVLAQDYPNLEIVVVDGGSTDRTREIARDRDPRIRVLEEPPLPPGWVGKNWACEVGARATKGEYLFFLDADVRLESSAIRTTVEWAERESADLATTAPRVAMEGFWERLVLPFFSEMVLVYFRAPRVNLATSSAAMANGQFLLVRRSSYDTVGGHAAVRGAVLEDVALARRFRAHGLTLRMALAPGLGTTRMYRDRHEMFEGLLKNVHGTEFVAARQVGFLVGLATLYLLPLGLLPFGLWTGTPLLIGVGAFLYLALFGKQVIFARGSGAPAVYGLLFPLAVAYYLRLVGSSLARGWARQPTTWKGRAYPLRLPPPKGPAGSG
ncbi:MAG: glycosyltransferase family 2 protein [Thermoplasmata archaeon]